MSDAPDITEIMSNVAAGPQSVSVDGNAVTQQDLSKLMELDRYLTAKRARRRGMVITPISPAGTV